MKVLFIEYTAVKWVLEVRGFKNSCLILLIQYLLQISSKQVGPISREELLLKSYEAIKVVLLQTH